MQVCKNCGAENKDGSMICSVCKSLLDEKIAEDKPYVDIFEDYTEEHLNLPKENKPPKTEKSEKTRLEPNDLLAWLKKRWRKLSAAAVAALAKPGTLHADADPGDSRGLAYRDELAAFEKTVVGDRRRRVRQERRVGLRHDAAERLYPDSRHGLFPHRFVGVGHQFADALGDGAAMPRPRDGDGHDGGADGDD